ncbi:MAG TPA: IPT/TIG domain-containing protein [Anaeromyxobacteraceae bacterium]|nr:IPT/TIG domain-containing protein [Anaeromyxobacteraceae bacterium]
MTNTNSRRTMWIALAALAALTGCDGQLEPSPARSQGAAPARPAEMAPGWIAAPAPIAAEPQAAGVPTYAVGQAQPDPEAYSHSYAPPPAPAAEPAPAQAAAAPSVDPGENVARTPPAGSSLRPNIANVSPSRGAPGTQLTITGSDFANVQVIIGGAVAQVTSQSSNAVTVVAPEGHAGPAAIVVTNRDGTYSVAGNAYQYM